MMKDFVLSAGHRDALLAHARDGMPQEICGLIASENGRVCKLYPVPNIAKRPRVSYYMDPEVQLQAFDDIDANGWELLAIYHSHPYGPDVPSRSDIAQSYYPDTVYVIISPPSVRGFYIREGDYQEVSIHIEPANSLE